MTCGEVTLSRPRRHKLAALSSLLVSKRNQPVEKGEGGGNAMRPATLVPAVHSGQGTGTGRGGKAGRTLPAAPLGNGRRPQPRRLNRRFRFWPAAISSASPFTLSSPRKRNRRSPCQSLASANSG